ncbi:hypothetical protein H6F98_12710 [Microcoleus sp. FACHB-SPT15]|uniref:hypothetical protein n=1 Tax=Microcoleus sp. FACHB-SPT15 TaxID=2692830 RepID=UPI001781FA92|nr:hypothetical protein [Microcoleus sp. FACHB-SPT15]MBD1806308.1 hypothetical protein [Microcoleus sp. FACHB-SPT15]
MFSEKISVPEVSLLPTLPAQLPLPKFQLDQTLKFGKVPSGDFGRVVGYVFAASATVQATGYHYLLLLDLESDSRKELGILCDWLFEDDALLMM